MSVRGLAAACAALMLLATVAFAIGAGIERNSGHTETTSEAGHADESGEAHDGPEGAHEDGTEGHAEEPQGEESEAFAGIDVESTPVVVVGVILSLALAGAVLRWPRWEALAGAAVFCVAFAALDGSELAPQLDENAGDIAALAALALLLHLAAAGAAALALKRGHAEPVSSVPA